MIRRNPQGRSEGGGGTGIHAEGLVVEALAVMQVRVLRRDAQSLTFRHMPLGRPTASLMGKVKFLFLPFFMRRRGGTDRRCTHSFVTAPSFIPEAVFLPRRLR